MGREFETRIYKTQRSNDKNAWRKFLVTKFNLMSPAPPKSSHIYTRFSLTPQLVRGTADPGTGSHVSESWNGKQGTARPLL
jgi:hypothetical protein